MHPNNVRIYVASAVSAVVVVAAVRDSIRVHRVERAKRAQIAEQAKLDIQAINRAHDTMIERINNGEIRSIAQLTEESNVELRFAKIAIREEN